MSKCRHLTKEIIEWIEKSPSAFHAAACVREQLLAAGFFQLDEREADWELMPGKGYFVMRNDSSIISFRMPERQIGRLHLLAGHSDSPTFKIKPDPEIVSAGCVLLNIEPYGGMLKSTWYDRPLTVAGRVLIDEGDAIRQKLIYLDRDLLVIPSLAIHMDRQANEKTAGNVQKDMLPLFAAGEEKGRFMRLIAEAAGLLDHDHAEKAAAEKILDMDLFLVNRDQPVIWGTEDEFLSGPRLDDLMCVFGTLRGFLDARPSEEILAVHCVFDNEEVGSRTKQGAESTFLRDCLARIAERAGLSASELQTAAARGMMISADNAHAVHPNHPDKADPVNRPALNGGIVLKSHAGQKYTTDGISGAIIAKLCREHGIPIQRFVNRSDQQGGSTLGNIANTQVSMNTADIGLAQLAMHSAYETAGAKDLQALAELSRVFCEEQLPDVV